MSKKGRHGRPFLFLFVGSDALVASLFYRAILSRQGDHMGAPLRSLACRKKTHRFFGAFLTTGY